MNVFKSLQFIASHPLNHNRKFSAIIRYFKWQLGSSIVKYPVIYPFTDKARLVIQKGMTGATGNLYCGLHEYHDMAFLIHLLRKDDLFGDIGANIGSYTVLASAHIGAKTFCFEPIPATFEMLLKNIAVNNIQELVTAHNIALGSQAGTIGFKTNYFNVMNHVAGKDEVVDLEVPVAKLDDIFTDRHPLLLKIDVEGFETEVLNGATNVLQDKMLRAIIIEFNGSGAQYGYDEQKIHEHLLQLGFRTCQYEPATRSLNEVSSFGDHNTIYVRDIDFVRERLATAPKIKILDTLL